MYVRGWGDCIVLSIKCIVPFFYIRLNAKYVFLYYMIYILQLKYC